MFGIVFGAAFGLFALYPLIHGAAIRFWALGLGTLFLVAALARPMLLAPLNRFWTKFGLALHRIVTPVALFVLFCVAVLPTGLVLRALGKDPLRLRFDPGATTYWIDRRPPGRADRQMTKQF